MIDKLLSFIVDRLNAALEIQFPNSGPHVVMGRIGGVESTALENKIIVSMANVEQETRTQGTRNFLGADPPLLNVDLFILVAANFTGNYAGGLKFLSAAVVFFHSSPVMTPATSPDFPADIQKLTIEFVNLSLQEVNNLWTVRGSLYLPSFLLKLTPLPMAIVNS